MIAHGRAARVKALCVGQAKTGTASLAGLLIANYRVSHEPDRAAIESLMDPAYIDETIQLHLRIQHGAVLS